MQRTDTLDFLIGHWTLIRLMSDGDGPLGVFEGRAAFVVTDERLPGKPSARYDESGILRPILSTCSVPAARRFLCRPLRGGPLEFALFGWPVVYPRRSPVWLMACGALVWRGSAND